MTTRLWRNVALVLIPLVIIAVLVLTFRALFEPVDREVRMPPTGPALVNPLYGLERSLVRHGTPTQSHARLDLAPMALRRGDGLVLYADPQGLPKPQAEALLAWVRNGGHLVLAMPADPESDLGTLLGALSVEAFDGDWRCERLLKGRKNSTEPMLCGGQRFTWTDGDARLAWGDDAHGFAFARFTLGMGSIDVFSDLGFLTNRQIERYGHWQLAYQALAPALDGRVHLVYDADAPPFWRVLLDDAWAIVIGAVLALVAWLAMRSQRFGPLLPIKAVDRRALLEHVQAAGEHAWRRGAARDLHAALRDAFLARLRRRNPMGFALQGDVRIDYLAKKLAVDPARVRTALIPPPTFHAESFREAIASLIQLGLRL